MPPTRDADSGAAPDGAFPAPPSDPANLGDIVPRDRRTAGLALRARASGRTYSYRDFITTSYKAGNVLRHLGVRPGDGVRIASERVPEPVLTFYGAAQLGAVTHFGADGQDTPRVTVVPAAREHEFDRPPGHSLTVYNDPPEDPSVTHWETEVWSENPAVHPVAVEGADPLFTAADRTYTHAETLEAATRAVDTAGIDPGTEVALRGPLTEPAVVVAGLVAPVLAGATIVLPDGSDRDATGAAPVAVDGEPRDASALDLGLD